jgi:tRNA (adenine22-N1)-methyltransferase
MREKELSRRLLAAFELVREESVAVDVGTDHAYLPIALVKSGKCDSVFASDVGKGPLSRAEENIKAAGLEEKIKTVLTDGASFFDGLANEFIIAGMGGELIFDIISRAEFLKSDGIHLVLQPMTKVPVLRKLLYKNGFFIEREILVFEDGKIYTVMSVFYSGDEKEISEIDAIVGFGDVDKRLLLKVLDGALYDLENKIKGKKDATAEILLKSEIESVREKIKEKNA